MKRTVRIFAILAVAFLAVGLFARLLEQRALYYPSRQLNADPSDAGLKYENVFFEASDGVRLHGWFVPSEGANATVLYFHGNAGNISHRVEIAKIFHERKMNFFIFDYRGFGLSGGFSGERGIYSDGRAAYRYLIDEKGIPPGRIVLYGKSLGAAIAAHTAAQARAGALICESGFTSTRDMAREFYGYLPLWFFVGQKYDTLGKIGKVTIPKLIIHSENDEIVPFSHGKRLFERATEPKRFHSMKGGHNDAFYIYHKEVMETIGDFLDAYFI